MKTGRKCKVCVNRQLEEINSALVEALAGKRSFRDISRQFNLSVMSIYRHACEHLGQQAREALQRTLTVSPDSDRLLELISYLTGHSDRTRHSFTPQAATNQKDVSA